MNVVSVLGHRIAQGENFLFSVNHWRKVIPGAWPCLSCPCLSWSWGAKPAGDVPLPPQRLPAPSDFRKPLQEAILTQLLAKDPSGYESVPSA